MAKIIAASDGVRIKMELSTDSERNGFNPINNSLLNSSNLISLWLKGVFNDLDGFEHTINCMSLL